MYKLSGIFFLLLIILGCKSTTSDIETNKDSIIKLQEERINQLEKQLKDSEVKTVDLIPKTQNNYNKNQANLLSSLDYFTIGSSEEEVIEIQGQPTSITKISNTKLFFYESSSITFKNGKVESYSNSGNLKIKVGTKSSLKTTTPLTQNNNKNQANLLSSLEYFTIGSSEEEVLETQGQPTSITKISNTKLFFYESSSITFKNGKVESYSNSGNLKIKVGAKPKNANKLNSNENRQSKDYSVSENNTTLNNLINENNEVKYMYFTFISTDIQINFDPITGETKPTENDYSKIYSITGYTYEKQESLEYCLTISYKRWTGKKVFLLANVYDDKHSTLMHWNNEKGRLYNHSVCSELMQYGIIEH